MRSLSDLTAFKNKILESQHRLKSPADLDPVLKAIGDARYVLLGEASHGTHEYYTWRSHLTKRLIDEKNFSFIAVEGDWPDCYRLNRYIKGYADGGNSALEVLREFNRWPTWMWANWEMVALAEWLKKYNATQPVNQKAGFYGLDVYSLWESLEAITGYLEKNDPGALTAAHKALECFEPHHIQEGFHRADKSYGFTASCAHEVEKLLAKIKRNMIHYNTDHEAVFCAEQNALVAVNAERYYHVMIQGGDASWNIRDRHMNETINRLMDFHGKDAKIIIWEHNTHIGDARATGMKNAGLVNVGQLVKEEHETKGVFRIGFGSYEGTVLAARYWSGDMYQMSLPKARPGSWEHLMHETGAFNKFIFHTDIQEYTFPIGHRAVGVVYDPEHESGNYVPSRMPLRYEAFIHLERTSGLHALHIPPDGLQMPATFPWGV